ncbi:MULTISPECIES: 3'-5' exonuclease [Aeromonas]|uniref:3'-5' exonuclease n=1 Tax=Aeromonas TaxID=642 RepID=UPI002B055FD6|nr:3'-5' exonuclease [Aeromonas jandaei]
MQSGNQVSHYPRHPTVTPCVAPLDIETLAKTVDAVIATIALVARNVVTKEVLGEFYVRVNLEQPGRVTDEETLSFWHGQRESNPEAWEEVFGYSDERIQLVDALIGLKSFIEDIERSTGMCVEVMGNGPEFDNTILTHASQQLGLGDLWHFRRNESMRTVVWMGRLLLGVDPKYQVPFIGVPHHALHDARHEGCTITEIVQAFIHALPTPGHE